MDQHLYALTIDCFAIKVNKLKLSTTEEGATNGVPASSAGSESKKLEIGSGDAASGKPPGDAASGKPPDTATVDGGTATEDDEKSKLTLKEPITTAADDKFCDIFPRMPTDDSHDISYLICYF